MNIGSQPETPREVPEADALEQQTPVLPEGSDDSGLAGALPDDAAEADFIEQHMDVRPGSAGYAGGMGALGGNAAEADLVEQALAPPLDDEEDYRGAQDEAF